jgi:hypothetical protein
MTLLEMKKQILKLIEEINPNSQLLTNDPDIANKINVVINLIQNEIARIKKIPAREEVKVREGSLEEITDLVSDFFQLNLIRDVKHNIYNSTIEFLETGTARIYYYKYPKQITESTDENTYKFELSTDVLGIIPYGVAGDLLKSDPASNYGQLYSNRYEQMLQRLDPRPHTGSIYFEGGDTYEFL